MPRNSRFCLVCLLVYLLLPNSSSNSSTKSHEPIDTTYLPLTKHDSDSHEPDETKFHQLNPTSASSQSDELDLDDSQPQHFFLNSLMGKYGNGVEMTFEGFEHLLQNIGLGKLLVFDHNISCHRVNGSGFVAFHSGHNHTGIIHSDVLNKSCSHIHDHAAHSHDGDEHIAHSHDHHESHERHLLDGDGSLEAEGSVHTEDSDHKHAEGGTGHEETVKHSTESQLSSGKTKRHTIEKAQKECLTPKLILNLFGVTNYRAVTEELFTDLCPVLIYQLDRKVCDLKATPHSHDHSEGHYHGDGGHEGHQHDDHEHPPAAAAEKTSDFDLSKIPAKVWGFSTVAVVVISLVGLLGVAVIPIMQKVFYNHLLQFLVALAVGALSGDALLHLLPHAMSGGHSEDSHGHGGIETGGEGHSMEGVYKGLCGLMGIYFFFIMERILTIFTDIKRKRKQKSKRGNKHMKDNADIGEKLANSEMECGEMMMNIHPNKALQGYADEAHSEHCKISFENTTTISHQHGSHGHSGHSNHTEDAEEGESMISHSSHGHGHSHCHDGVPNSVSAIAWMVILGDGIHNFSDGLAIGAAFSNSITGGFSTAIAVFCHELPHEIGDFAMLLRAGMSAKQAIIYNCLSSILCFIGMLIGVAIGNIQDASLWIFAVVGGMFLYIALVDMLPEMTSVATQKGENPYKHLLLQVLGMALGAGIMLTIALYEDQLRTALD